jgi:hypothetical protein
LLCSGKICQNDIWLFDRSIFLFLEKEKEDSHENKLCENKGEQV